MTFLLWHAVAMVSLIAVSFAMGYYTGYKVRDGNRRLDR